MSTPTPFEPVPKTTSDWLVAAKKAKVENTSLFSFRDHCSASKVTKPQFLSFRTLVIPRKVQDFNPARWGLGQKLVTATQELNQSPDFQNLLNAIRNPPAPPTGDFSQILKMHAEVTRDIENNYPEKLQKADETPVNVSLICLLQGIADIATGPVVRWRHTKVQFEAIFGSLPGGVKRGMLAIMDGQLQSTVSHEVRAIVECKRHERAPQDNMIGMQEAALFVAWIKEYSRYPNLSRVLVSQDSMQLYITFAETPLKWREFLLQNKTSGNTRSFMRLHRFGPWDLGQANHVNQAAAILLAITK
ncbi:hypothetical protein BDW59DRAFT_180238 [Aspergillus cavernicola]|uniref:Uncharacterized protein n=1 Tax=Aspergillus cavernicola TaxID=176166 RepID=A0ABR4I9C8_9EURO